MSIKLFGNTFILLIWLCLIVLIVLHIEELKEFFVNIGSIIEKYPELGPMKCVRIKSQGDGLENIPNCETVFKGEFVKLKPSFVKINSEGFRGKEYSIKKPNNTIRIIILGDSFTFGWGLNLEETFPYILEQKLNKEYKGINFEVLNFGVIGHNTKREIEDFERKGIKYNPDIVVVAFLENDDETWALETKISELIKKNPKNIEEQINKLMLDKRYKNISLIIEPTEKLINLSKTNGFDIIIYALEIAQKQEKLFINFSKKYSNFYYMRSSINFASKKKYYLHEKDKHPSYLANKIYANDLFGIITYLLKKNNIKFN